MKRNFTKALLLLIVLQILNKKIFAQACPAIVINNTTVTNASCPSGGMITVTATGNTLQYAITDGPTGYLATSNNTGIFAGLISGTYTIKITDNCGVSTTLNSIVNNTFNVFSISSSNVTNSCSSFVPGGTINATINGGKSPYQYDIVPVGSSPLYSSNTASTSFTKNIIEFGNFRVFAKDACGEVRTRDITIEKAVTKPFFWYNELIFNRPCTEIIDGLNTTSLFMYLQDANQVGINTNMFIGSKLKIFKPSISNSITNTTDYTNCNTPIGALLNTLNLTTSNVGGYNNNAIIVTIPKEDLILQLITQCGDTMKVCYNYNEGLSDAPNLTYNLIQSTCTGTWNTQTLNIVRKTVVNMTETINYSLRKVNNTQILSNNGNFYNLAPADFPVNITATDACGKVVVKTINLPIQGSALSSLVDANWNYSCTNSKNSVSANIYITGGDLPGIETATNVVITGGPANVIPFIGYYDSWIFGYVASNLVANYTYKVRVTNTCGEKDSLTFSVPADSYGQYPLNWNLTASVNQVCGQNIGNITAKANFSGSITPTYSIFNVLTPNNVYQSNNTGIFNNIPSGTYKVKFVVDATSAACLNNYITDSTNVTIINSIIGQSITKKTIMICETGGVPTASGKAIVDVNGVGPFTYEIIKSSLIGTGGEVWNVSSSNNVNNSYSWDLPLAGDPFNTVYTLRSTDNCGNKITTIAALQPISPAQSINQVQPCIGQINYTIGLQAYAGNGFTYRWVKLPDLATTIATTNTLQFSGTYQNIADGTYKCFVNYGTCIDREYTFLLNSAICGNVLPVNLISFNGKEHGESIELNWFSQSEVNLNKYILERSVDQSSFEGIVEIDVKQNTGIANNYTYTDNKLTLDAKNFLYRLKMMDDNGSFKYSTILKFNKDKSYNSLTIFPNPIKTDANLNFKSPINGKSILRIIGQTGKLISTQNYTVVKGSNSIKITPNIPMGNYAMELIIGDQKLHSKFIKL